MSAKYTSFPYLSFPIGLFAKSISTVPANAYATTNGGLAK